MSKLTSTFGAKPARKKRVSKAVVPTPDTSNAAGYPTFTIGDKS
jgi:hypothetical protein